MDTQERLDLIREAQEKLQEAIELLRQAAQDDPWAENYIVAPLEIVASRNHGYLDGSPNLDTWVEQIEDAESVKQE